MKKFSLSFKIFLLFIASFFYFTACETTDNFSCPYVISSPRVESGEFEDKHKFAGLHFGLYNDSEKEIESFVLSCMIYDSEGKNPFACSNCIVSRCDWKIKGGALVDFVIDLDHYVSVIPCEAYQVDYIYLREIRYADGSSWKDPYGMFCIREEHE